MAHSRRPAGRFGSMLLAVASLPAVAFAQVASPTSPLGRPATAEAPPRAETPLPPVPTTTPNLDPSSIRIEMPAPTFADAPVDRSTLLPEGVSSASGLTEADVVERATHVSLGARRADARRGAADAAVATARRGFVPRTTVGFRYSRLSSYTPGTIATFDTAGCLADIAGCTSDSSAYMRNVVLQQPILNQYALTTGVVAPISDYLGSQRHELRAAQEDAEAASATADAAVNDAELTGLEAYWEVVRARAQQRLAADSAALAARRRDEVRQRRTQGIGTDVDVLAAEATSRTYAQLVEVARTRVELAESNLRDVLELDAGVELVLAVDLEHLPGAPSGTAAELQASADSVAPSVIAARHTASAADERIRTERARMLPTLSASFNHAYSNPNPRIFPQTTAFTATWDIGVSLSWSLDGALLADARMSQRRALAEDSHLAAEQAEQNAGRAVIAARGQLLSALANVDARDASTASAGRNAAAALARRAAGLATETDLRDADAAFLRARLDLVDAVVDVHLAHARLESALGNPPHVAPTSSTHEVR